jgi:hypothetical protein
MTPFPWAPLAATLLAAGLAVAAFVLAKSRAR